MEEKLKQLFKNRANAYLNTIDESVVQGMDEGCFIKTVKEAFALYDVVGRSEQLVCDKCDFVELQGEIYQCTKCYKIEDRLAN